MYKIVVDGFLQECIFLYIGIRNQLNRNLVFHCIVDIFRCAVLLQLIDEIQWNSSFSFFAKTINLRINRMHFQSGRS